MKTNMEDSVRTDSFKTKTGPHLNPNEMRTPDFEFPCKEEMFIDKHIVGFIHNPNDPWAGFNFILSNGQRSQLKIEEPQMPEDYQEVRFDPLETQVRKVVMQGNHELACIKFFDIAGRMIIQGGKESMHSSSMTREFYLEKNQRLVGVKSKRSKNGMPRHEDLVFVIGWLE